MIQEIQNVILACMKSFLTFNRISKQTIKTKIKSNARFIDTSFHFCRVVTGVRIIKRNGVIQLAISQRTLLPYGQTDAKEQNTWKYADYQFAVTDRGPSNGIDYFTLTYENRSINLDDLTVPQGKLVTGVRFFHLNGHIVLQIRATDFNYFSGKLLNLDYTPWVVNKDGGQHEIVLNNPGHPIEASVEINYPKRAKNAFVTFGPSAFDTDIGQSTIPFIENLPIESKNPVVLAGVGLTHKGQVGSGGFIAPKLITYEFPIADPIVDEEYVYIE